MQNTIAQAGGSLYLKHKKTGITFTTLMVVLF